MRVNASVDEADIGRIAPGQSATFTVDAYPGQAFSGTVAQVRLAPVVERYGASAMFGVVALAMLIVVADIGLFAPSFCACTKSARPRLRADLRSSGVFR